jgi:hypothetical protein
MGTPYFPGQGPTAAARGAGVFFQLCALRRYELARDVVPGPGLGVGVAFYSN